VHILEDADRAGGTVRTSHRNGFLIEGGPNSILDTSPQLRQLIIDLGLTDSLEWISEVANKRYVVRGGELRALPLSPPAFLKSNLFSWRAKLRLLKEPFVSPAPADAEETLAEFVLRRLGREFLDYAIDPFVAGTFAGRPEDLSVSSAFPRLHKLEQEYGSLIVGAIKNRRKGSSAGKTKKREREREDGPQPGGESTTSGGIGTGARESRSRPESGSDTVKIGPGARLFSFSNGLGTLVDALVAEAGDALHLDRGVKSVGRTNSGFEVTCPSTPGGITARCRSLLFTIPAHTYGQVEFAFPFTPSASLDSIYYPPVTVVFLGYRHPPSACRELDGFGFLVPRCERREILGTIWNSTTFGDRAPEGGLALTTFVGGSRQPEKAALPDDELLDVVFRELDDLMGLKGSPDEVAISRWPRAIPQYRVGHSRLVAEVEAFEREHPGLFLGGNFRGGISMADCFTQAHAISGRVADALRPGR
jgi:oxygen-dependent protoporphyrinogen oxidase